MAKSTLTPGIQACLNSPIWFITGRKNVEITNRICSKQCADVLDGAEMHEVFLAMGLSLDELAEIFSFSGRTRSYLSLGSISFSNFELWAKVAKLTGKRIVLARYQKSRCDDQDSVGCPIERIFQPDGTHHAPVPGVLLE